MKYEVLNEPHIKSVTSQIVFLNTNSYPLGTSSLDIHLFLQKEKVFMRVLPYLNQICRFKTFFKLFLVNEIPNS